MKTRYLRLIKKQRRFTLIELLAVILILGIIALIAIPTVSSVVEESRHSAAVSTGNQLLTGAIQYCTSSQLSNDPVYYNIKSYEETGSNSLSDLLDVKGDLPSYDDLAVFEFNSQCEVKLLYNDGDYSCSNLVDNEGNPIFQDNFFANIGDRVSCSKGETILAGKLETTGNVVRIKKYYYKANDTYKVLEEDFHDPEVSSTITRIITINKIDIPENTKYSWDISEEQNGSIMAWIEDKGEDRILYIGSFDAIHGNTYSIRLFSDLPNVKSISFGNFSTEGVKNFRYFFSLGTSLEYLDLSNFDTSSAEDMYAMFSRCYSLKKINMSSFNTSKVTGMAYMFFACRSLEEIDITNFDTSKVKSMHSMFRGEPALNSDKTKYINFNQYKIKGLENLNTSKVENMTFMFYGNAGLGNLDLSKWDVSNVTSMSSMFKAILNTDIIDMSGWKTLKLQLMDSMFSSLYGTDKAQLYSSFKEVRGLEDLYTNEVTDMSNLFYRSNGGFTEILDLSKWNTGKVTKMTQIFRTIKNVKTIYVGDGWSTANVTDLSSTYFYVNYDLVGARKFDSKYTDGSMANYTDGYLTYKAN